MSDRFTEDQAAAVVRRNARPKPARLTVDSSSVAVPPPALAPSRARALIPAAQTKAQQSTERLLFQLQAAGLPIPEREYYFARPARQCRFDLAYPNRGLAIEIEGLVFPPAPRWHETPEHRLSGRHVSVKGYLDDIRKYGLAFSLGWSVLRIVHAQIDSGEALMLIERRLTLPTTWVPIS